MFTLLLRRSGGIDEGEGLPARLFLDTAVAGAAAAAHPPFTAPAACGARANRLLSRRRRLEDAPQSSNYYFSSGSATEVGKGGLKAGNAIKYEISIALGIRVESSDATENGTPC